jgi:hypothetical protein
LCRFHAFAIMAGVERQRLKSRAVISAGYDDQTLELELEFRSGHVYRYEDVPPGIFAWLLRIENKGGFVRRMVQGRYVERVMPRSGPPAPREGPATHSLEVALRASIDRLGKPAP